MSKEADLDQQESRNDKAHELSDIEVVDGKRSRKGFLLRPQPSNDPNDPLVSSRISHSEMLKTCLAEVSRVELATPREILHLTVCFFAFLGLANSSSFTVAINPVAAQFHTTTTRAGYLTSIQVLFAGLGCLFWVPVIRIVGKRPVYLVSMLLLAATNIWGYLAKSFGSLLASRLIGGFMSAAADAPVPSVVADLFYFHERGHCMMIFHTAISAGIFLGPLINAYIVQYAGWRWMCGFMAIASAVNCLVAIFTIHETAYKREEVDLERPAAEYADKKGWWSSLSITSGYDPEASFWSWLANTVVLLAYPPVVFVGVTIGVFVGL